MDPFVAEIRIFPFNFPPRGWAFCDGQILAISQNTALFSLLGTTYGGNGQTNFALPNFQGSGPIHPGQGPGLSLRDLGEMGGVANVTLLQGEIPSHIHGLLDSNGNSQLGAAGTADTDNPTNTLPSGATLGAAAWKGGFSSLASPTQTMMSTPTQVTGASLPHNNLAPFLTLNFCIALQGVYPPRT